MDTRGDISLDSGSEGQVSPRLSPATTRTGDEHGLTFKHTCRVKYTVTELLQWKDCKLRLPLNVFHDVSSLGICRKKKTRRGTRGGRRKMAKMHDYSGVQPGMEMTHDPATNGGMVGTGSIDSYTTSLQPLQHHHQSQQHVLQQQQPQQHQQQQPQQTADLMLDYMQQSAPYQPTTPQ